MDNNENLIFNCLPTVKSLLLAKGKIDIVDLLKKEHIQVSFYTHDNWNGGIDYYYIVILVPPKKYVELENEWNNYSEEISRCFNNSLGIESIVVNDVRIKPDVSLEKKNINNNSIHSSSDIWFQVYDKKNINNINPQHIPCYILNFDSGWNDFFTYKTLFQLLYYRSCKDVVSIGHTKIMNINDNVTYKPIPKIFNNLPKGEYCSLGSDIRFYENLKSIVGQEECVKVLKALSDCSIDPIIAKKYRKTDCFEKSLIREISAERALREAIFEINDVPKDNSYNFDFKCDGTRWSAKFSKDCNPYGRCLGLIGENGVGKTTLMKKFITYLLNGNDDCFVRKPMYSAIIVLTDTYYDSYDELKEFDSQNLSIDVGYLQDDKLDNIINCLKNIKQFSRTKLFSSLLKEMDHLYGNHCHDLLDNLIQQMEVDSDSKILDDSLIKKVVSCMSSGGRHLFSLTAFICEKIWYDTLIVIEEPEVHLHPHAIMDFMELLFKVLEKYESYAIIVTHSPLIIREMIGRNVFVMSKVIDDVRLIQSIDVECFGENIAFLYYKIFGYDETQSIFYKEVKKLADNGSNYNEIEKKMETSGLPLSLNSKLIIQKVLSMRNDNE